MLYFDTMVRWGPTVFVLSFVCFVSMVAAQDRYGPEIASLNGYDGYEMTDQEKRAGLKAVPFTCNGYDNIPQCLHGGRGPKKTQTRSGNFCVCLCPRNWLGPECKLRSSHYNKREDEEEDGDKRAWGNLNSLQLGKRLTLPWSLKQIKRNLPWALKSFPVRRDADEVPVDDEEEEEEEKRTFPWALKTMPKPVPGKKNFPWALKTMEGPAGGKRWAFGSVPLGKRYGTE